MLCGRNGWLRGLALVRKPRLLLLSSNLTLRTASTALVHFPLTGDETITALASEGIDPDRTWCGNERC